MRERTENVSGESETRGEEKRGNEKHSLDALTLPYFQTSYLKSDEQCMMGKGRWRTVKSQDCAWEKRLSLCLVSCNQVGRESLKLITTDGSEGARRSD